MAINKKINLLLYFGIINTLFFASTPNLEVEFNNTQYPNYNYPESSNLANNKLKNFCEDTDKKI